MTLGMGWLAVLLWGGLFAASHLVLSSAGVRAPLLRRLGERGFQALYSLVAFATFVPFVGAWWQTRHGGPLLWMLRDVAAVEAGAIALSVAGFAFMVGSFFQPSPTGMVPGAPVRARGLTAITRHALFMGIALWATAHVLVNGWASDVAFFGVLAGFAVVGSAHQDARKRAADDRALASFYAQTSLVPFAAVLSGRVRLEARDLPWAGLTLGAAAGVALYLAHPWLFR